MIELVVFDMAGTTVDEDNVVYKTVQAAINAAGFEYSLDDVLEHGAGKEKSQAIRDVLALDNQPHPDEQVLAIFSDFKSRLAKAYDELAVKEQPGATQAFQALRKMGIRVVLNTGYDRKTAEGLINKIGWSLDEDFDGLVTASDVETGRPGPEMIHKAMELVEIRDSANVAKVGDSQIDIDEGKNADCGMTVGITTGAQTEEQLMAAGPTTIVHSLSEFVELARKSTVSD